MSGYRSRHTAIHLPGVAPATTPSRNGPGFSATGESNTTVVPRAFLPAPDFPAPDVPAPLVPLLPACPRAAEAFAPRAAPLPAVPLPTAPLPAAPFACDNGRFPDFPAGPRRAELISPGYPAPVRPAQPPGSSQSCSPLRLQPGSARPNSWFRPPEILFCTTAILFCTTKTSKTGNTPEFCPAHPVCSCITGFLAELGRPARNHGCAEQPRRSGIQGGERGAEPRGTTQTHVKLVQQNTAGQQKSPSAVLRISGARGRASGAGLARYAASQSPLRSVEMRMPGCTISSSPMRAPRAMLAPSPTVVRTPMRAP